MGSSNATGGPDERVADEERHRCVELNIGNEEFVIFDRENHQAWIQSSAAVTVGEFR